MAEPAKNSDLKLRLAALLITLLIVVLSGALLCIVTLKASASRLPDLEENDGEILFTEVEIKQIPYKPVPAVDNQPAASASAEVSGTSAEDSGSGEESAPLISANQPQPAKQEQNPEPKPVAKPEPKPDPQAEAAARIRARVGKSNVTKADEGAGNSDSGNAPVGQITKASNGLGLDGRSLLRTATPSITNATGKVTVKISVNADGHVTSATVTGTSGFGSREAEVRQACRDASLQLLYSPEPKRPTQSGTITWIIK